MFWVNPDDYMFYELEGRHYELDSPYIERLLSSNPHPRTEEWKEKEGIRLTNREDTEKELATRFNKLGSLGWELVGSVWERESHRIVCFKRELG